VVVIGSERVGRRVVPSKDRATPHWTVVRPNGGAWGNVQDSSADSLPPPPPPPPSAITGADDLCVTADVRQTLPVVSSDLPVSPAQGLDSIN